MPVNEQNIEAAKAFLNKNRDNPKIDKDRYFQLEKEVSDFYSYKGETKEAGNGKNFSEVKDKNPNIYEPEGKSYMSNFGTQDSYQFYEPSLDEAKKALQDPVVMKSLGYESVMTPQQAESINDSTPEYRKFADLKWNETLEKAKSENVPAYRYSKLSWLDNTADKAFGFASKHLGGTVAGLDDALTGGIGKQLLPEKYKKGIERAQEESTAGDILGNVAGLVTPVGLAGKAGSIGLKLGGKAATKLGGKGLGKAAGAFIAGGAATAVEEGAKDIVDTVGGSLRGEKSAESILKDDFTNIIQNTAKRMITGGALGAGFHGIGIGAGKIADAADVSLGNALKYFKKAGGDVEPKLIGALQPPKKMKDYYKKGLLENTEDIPEALAVQEVAPKIKASVEKQEKELREKVGKNVENYLNSKEANDFDLIPDTYEAVQSIADAFKQRMATGALGDTVNLSPQVNNILKNNIQKFAQRMDIPIEMLGQIENDYAKRGIKLVTMLREDADKLIKPANLQGPPKDAQNVISILVPNKLTARQITNVKDEISQALKYSSKEGGLDSEGLKIVEKGLNKVRDRFKGNIYTTKEALEGQTVEQPARKLVQKNKDKSVKLDATSQELGKSVKNLDKTDIDPQFLDTQIDGRQFQTTIDPTGKTMFVDQGRPVAKKLVSKDEYIVEPDKYNQLTHSFDDGTEVSGFSALQAKHHQELSNLEKIKEAVGYNRKNGIQAEINSYRRNPTKSETDDILLEEAKKAGVNSELDMVAGMHGYQDLLNKARFEQLAKPIGKYEAIVKGGKLRANPILRALAGQSTNPFNNDLTPAGRILKELNKQGMINKGMTEAQIHKEAEKVAKVESAKAAFSLGLAGKKDNPLTNITEGRGYRAGRIFNQMKNPLGGPLEIGSAPLDTSNLTEEEKAYLKQGM